MTPAPLTAIAAIEKAMEGVTPGLWYDAPGTTTGRIVVAPNTTKAKRRIAALGGPDREANAAYIAACSPDRMGVVLALARQAEALQRENAELRKALKECHAALKMMISPGEISGSTVLGAFAAAKSAEARARALLGGENAGN